MIKNIYYKIILENSNITCLCEDYLYEKYEDIAQNLYLYRLENNNTSCSLATYLKNQVDNPCFVWLNIKSPFLNIWFFKALQHCLVIRRLSLMNYNYKLTCFEDFYALMQHLALDVISYTTKFNINDDENIEKNIKEFYKNSWDIFSIKNIDESYKKDFHKHINPLLYYNLTNAKQIKYCISSLEITKFVFIPLPELFQNETHKIK